MKSHTLTTIATALLALSLGGTAAARQIKLEAAMAEPVILAGEKKTTYLKVGLTGFEWANQERPPVNVAIVLDKSGSMGGDKIKRARDAAKLAIDRLGKDDIVSVISYDSTVKVVVPATKVSDKAEIFKMIDAIRPGGNTALFAGVAKGAAEVRKFLRKDVVNRVILVSDGLANIGSRTPGALGELGLSLSKEGISVSSIGLGADYNEDLMFAIAERSDGNHAFAESGKELAAIFDSEFGDVLSVVAQEVLVSIECDPGVRPVRVLGREAEISGQTCTVLLNQLYSAQEKYVLLEVEIPASVAGKRRDVADVAVSYANMATKVTDEMTSKVAVRFTATASAVVDNANRDVMVASAIQVATLNNKKAMMLCDEGKVTEASQLLLANGAACASAHSVWGSEELLQFAENNIIDAERLEGTAWMATRKAMRADQFKNFQQVRGRGYNSRHNEFYGDGKMTQAELKKYLETQQSTLDAVDSIELIPGYGQKRQPKGKGE